MVQCHVNSEGIRFESRAGSCPSFFRFSVCFLNSCREIRGYALKSAMATFSLYFTFCLTILNDSRRKIYIFYTFHTFVSVQFSQVCCSLYISALDFMWTLKISLDCDYNAVINEPYAPFKYTKNFQFFRQFSDNIT